ncbi:hypothetical protein E3P81_01732 [Wallemia ichthyophaga]|nr:hypothetical protein E3P97_01731 [Wallemia ichthyophaga]TIB05078.1 hypothetical protein E3P96_01451 [Wallemia ichthyophaga]TIB33471.1 hypothetical protein E3P85_01385 [Wallemia ichthyophaga]TIB47421.1 hypothetical protein E3P82_01731 [Wallemia ichthyophaga]TIB51883.1 hypothetical protein E3P81_01732 [Wallemia ichthyophaga]
MTLYYSLVFGLLSAEVLTFLVLVAPMPFAFKQRFFKFLSTNPLVAKLQYSLKISLIFTSILFFDAVQRMLKVVKEGQAAKEEHSFNDVRSESNFAARKYVIFFLKGMSLIFKPRFYSQRNVYLTGFTLFLSLILSRVFGIIMDLIKAEEELSLMKKDGDSSSAETFKKQLDSKDREISKHTLNFSIHFANFSLDILKKQSTQNNQAMNDLVDNANTSSGSKKDK